MKAPYLLEKRLPQHIRQYMESHPKLDVGELTDYLIKNYREYRKKIKVRFIPSVIKAYKYQLFCKGINPDDVKMFFEDEDYRLQNIEPEKRGNGQAEVLPKRKKLKLNENEKDSKLKTRQFYTLEKEELCEEDNYLESHFFKETICKMMSTEIKTYMICGAPQCGKTTLIKVFAMVMGAHLLRTSVIRINADNYKNSFNLLFKLAETKQPCVVLIEFDRSFMEDDHIQRNNYINNYICIIQNCINEIQKRQAKVYVFMETTQSEKFKDSFQKDTMEFTIPALTVEGRLLILKKLCRKRVCKEEVLQEVATNTPGYVAGDLVNLVDKVLFTSYCRKNPEGTKFCLPMKCTQATHSIELMKEDFKNCLINVTPTLMLTGFPAVPETSFEEIGGLDDVKEILRSKISVKIRRFSSDSSRKQSGILLWGPPGCGKTLLAKAVANKSNLNFLSISSADLLDKYQGESERNIRSVFDRALKVTPCIIFFDEFDAMCMRRTKNTEGGSRHSIVNTLLTKMQGAQSRAGVFVMATTNKPHLLDPAVLRPGRFDTIIYVGMPNYESRLKVLLAVLANETLSADVNLEELSAKTDGFSSADIMNLCKEASKISINQVIQDEPSIKECDAAQIFDNINREYHTLPDKLLHRQHFISALEVVQPSISNQEMEKYMKIGNRINSVNWTFNEKQNAVPRIQEIEEISDEMDVCIF